jgi:hypothetical protein
MEMVNTIVMITGLFVSVGNLCVMIYAFTRFLKKPHESLEEKILLLESKIKEIENSLLKGNDKFREQDETNTVLTRTTLALIEFEIQYCLLEDKPMSKGLEVAKEELNSYLSNK